MELDFFAGIVTSAGESLMRIWIVSNSESTFSTILEISACRVVSAGTVRTLVPIFLIF
jgi:hypothetical protein